MPRKPQIFTEAELQAMRDSVNAHRVPGAYEPGRWMTSPFSRDRAVVGPDVPARAFIRDITLRNLEQMPGLNLDRATRQRLLEEIVAIGVPEVQLSMFGRGHTVQSLAEDVRVVKAVNPACQTVMTQARNADDVVQAAEAGVEIVQFGGAPAAGAAPLRIGGAFQAAWEGKDWRAAMLPRNQGQQFDRILGLIAACKAQGIVPSCTVNQANYADEAYLRDYAAQMGAAGAAHILLADGPSGCAPEAFAHMTRIVRRNAPDVRVILHAHNSFALANANSLAGVVAGAQGVEVTVNGYCSISGQADLAHVAVSLEALYGVSTGIDLAGLTRLRRVAETIVGIPVSRHHPLTGDEAFNCGGSDSVIQELDVDPLIHWSLVPGIVGNQRNWTVTRSTGPFSMWEKLDQLGIDAERRHIEPILHRCWAEMQANRRPLSDDDIRRVAVTVQAEVDGATQPA